MAPQPFRSPLSSMPPLNRQDTRPSIHSWWSDSNPGLQGPIINIHAMAKPLVRWMYASPAFHSLPPSSMPPLTRHDTRPSIYSWWSDNNPGLQGPTINLHTAAKPLMRRLYHRQATQLIRKNRNSPLSTATLEIYWSYIPWGFVSSSTKGMILEELMMRSASETDARAIVDSPVFNFIMEMLESPDIVARIYSCRLLGRLAGHESSIPTILEVRIHERLMALWRDEKSEVITGATWALAQIAQWLDGARAIVDSPVFNFIAEMLESPDVVARIYACRLLGRLAGHESSIPAMLEIKICERLVSLWRNEESEVIMGAMWALAQVAQWLDGAQAIVDAKVLDHVLISPNQDISVAKPSDYERLLLILLESPRSEVKEWTCQLLGRLASHYSTAPAIFEVELKPCTRLVDEDVLVIAMAMYALSQIARWSDGAEAVIDAMVLDHVLILLEVPRSEVQTWTCELVGRLTSHNCTVAAILELKPHKQLASLCRNNDIGVVEKAMYALSEIAGWVEHAPTIVDTKTLNHFLKLLNSPRSEIRALTCKLLGRLANHKPTSPAILDVEPCVRLVSLLHDDDPEIIVEATHALSVIARSADGAQAVVNANAADHILELLELPSSSIQCRACQLLGRLAGYEATAPTVLALKPHKRLGSLLSTEVYWAAVFALSQIALWSQGAEAIVIEMVLDHVPVLLESARPDVRESACTLLGRLASHNSTAPAVLNLRPYLSLVSSLSDEDSRVIARATYALSQIARWSLEGARTIVNVKALKHVLELLESQSLDVRGWTCELIGSLASQESTVGAILEFKLCERLVDLLWEPETRASAVFALCAISEFPNGVGALSDTNISEELQGLSQVSDAETRVRIHKILDNLYIFGRRG
ncbi:hypothetical protein MVEN_01347300 [Mycena venus]|uniref:ARM repeat-containing protein n=1 Tax=Mycena venus TaxID=2733690 RepID=A0A8H6XZE0_9AGAR|nr:hypothetical protein MVEN_01347300 [Mycena venus]